MSQRIPFLDYLRVTACLMVMLVHASENFYGVIYDADATGGLAGNLSLLVNEQNRFWVSFWDGAVSRTAVPAVMTSSMIMTLSLSCGL